MDQSENRIEKYAKISFLKHNLQPISMARELSLFSANVDMMRAPKMAARMQFVVADLISGWTTVSLNLN